MPSRGVKKPKLCTDTHICRSCGKECRCDTYLWACAWRNADEDDSCLSCLAKIAQEMEAWEAGQETT